MSIKSEKIDKQDKAKEYLLEVLKPGDTVYTILNHVSSKGMSRRIWLVTKSATSIVTLTYNAAILLDYRYNRDYNSLVVGGCGMDMGYHVVYNLSRALFGDGYALNQQWL